MPVRVGMRVVGPGGSQGRACSTTCSDSSRSSTRSGAPTLCTLLLLSLSFYSSRWDYFEVLHCTISHFLWFSINFLLANGSVKLFNSIFNQISLNSMKIFQQFLLIASLDQCKLYFIQLLMACLLIFVSIVAIVLSVFGCVVLVSLFSRRYFWHGQFGYLLIFTYILPQIFCYLLWLGLASLILFKVSFLRPAV